MRKSKTGLLDTSKVSFSVVEGVPTIEIIATLTTRDRVGAVIEQLNKLAQVLPEARVRKPKLKAKNSRPINSGAEARAIPPARED